MSDLEVTNCDLKISHIGKLDITVCDLKFRLAKLNIEIMRAFVRLRHVLTANKELALQLAALEERIDKRLLKQDQTIVEILKAIRSLMGTSPPSGRPIGLVTEKTRQERHRFTDRIPCSG